MLANMASSLIEHKRIETTLAKAKALRVYIEPLITKSKDDTTHSRRTVFAYLKQKEAITELFRVVAPKIADRPGGYTRVLKIGFRKGDAAEMAIIELVDFNEAAMATSAKPEVKKSTTRRGRTKKDAVEAAAPVAAKKETKKAPKATKAEEASKQVKEPVEKLPVVESTVVESPEVESPATEATEEQTETKV